MQAAYCDLEGLTSIEEVEAAEFKAHIAAMPAPELVEKTAIQVAFETAQANLAAKTAKPGGSQETKSPKPKFEKARDAAIGKGLNALAELRAEVKPEFDAGALAAIRQQMLMDPMFAIARELSEAEQALAEYKSSIAVDLIARQKDQERMSQLQQFIRASDASARSTIMSLPAGDPDQTGVVDEKVLGKPIFEKWISKLAMQLCIATPQYAESRRELAEIIARLGISASLFDRENELQYAKTAAWNKAKALAS
jgi:hypothetical protein